MKTLSSALREFNASGVKDTNYLYCLFFRHNRGIVGQKQIAIDWPAVRKTIEAIGKMDGETIARKYGKCA
jgi:hypothetical protein